MKWKWRKDRRSERNLCNCGKKPEKIQDFNGVWTRDLAIPVRCSTNWAMKPLTLGAGQLWVHMFPWKKWVLMIYEINHIWTAEMKWKWRNDRRSERNLCNCVKKPEGFKAQLVEHRTGNREVTGSNPVEVLNFFQASLRNCINCVHCDDHFFISFPQFIFALNSSGRWSRKIRRFCRGRHLRPGQMIWEEKKFWHTSGLVKSF